MEWIRIWEVTTTWQRASDSPHNTARLVEHARTPAELRAILEGHRADPLASYRQKTLRVLDGDWPTSCLRGHGYPFGSATRVVQDWAVCRCGGHNLFLCAQRGCDDVRVEPMIALDCEPTMPARFKQDPERWRAIIGG